MVLAACCNGRGVKGWVYELECDEFHGGDNADKSSSFQAGRVISIS